MITKHFVGYTMVIYIGHANRCSQTLKPCKVTTLGRSIILC